VEPDDAELMHEHPPVDGVVLGEQYDASFALGHVPGWLPPLLEGGAPPRAHPQADTNLDGGRVGDGKGQSEAQGRSLAGVAVHAYVAAHQRGQPPADHEPEARSS
jgi:hypothetical protein